LQDESFVWTVTEEKDLPAVPAATDRCPRVFKPHVVVGMTPNIYYARGGGIAYVWGTV